MTFIKPVWFRVKLPQVAIMDFIARTEPAHYYLVPAGDGLFYGMFLSEDTIEYLTNEFTVHSLEIIGSDEVKRILALTGCRVFGNKELIHF